MELVERVVAGLGDLGHVRRTRGVADGDIHEEIPAVLSQVRNEQDHWLSKPMPFFLDSQSAEDRVLYSVYHNRSKHFEIKYHWVREHADSDRECRTATLIYVRTGEQTADIFTKSLTGPAFDTFRRRTFGTERKSSTDVVDDLERKCRPSK